MGVVWQDDLPKPESLEIRVMHGDTERCAAVLSAHRLPYFDERKGCFAETPFWCPEESWHLTGWGALYARAEKPARLEAVRAQAACPRRGTG